MSKVERKSKKEAKTRKTSRAGKKKVARPYEKPSVKRKGNLRTAVLLC